MVVRLPWLGRHPARLAACVILALLAVMAVLAPLDRAPGSPGPGSSGQAPGPFPSPTRFGTDELAIATPLGVVSTVRPRSWIARMVTGYNALAMTVPTFWLGILLVLDDNFEPEIRTVLGPGRGGAEAVR